MRAAAGIGLLAGFLSGLFGVGGGIMIVPGLVLWMRMDQRRAHGTSLAAVVPIAATGLVGYAIHSSVDWPVAGLLTAGAVAGAVAGTSALQRLDVRVLRFVFAAFLIAAAVRLLVEVPEAAGRRPVDAAMAAALVAIGLGAGALAGLLGVGGGIMTIPAMVLLFSVPEVVAKGTSLLVIIPTALIGTIGNRRRGNADLRTAATIGLLGIASAAAGSQVAHHLDPTLSSVLFGMLLLAVAVRLVLERSRV